MSNTTGFILFICVISVSFLLPILNIKSFNKGIDRGLKDGYESGFTTGRADGFKSGYQEGEMAGYKAGHDAGIAEEQKDRLSRDEIDMVRQVINVMSWDGEPHENKDKSK